MNKLTLCPDKLDLAVLPTGISGFRWLTHGLLGCPGFWLIMLSFGNCSKVGSQRLPTILHSDLSFVSFCSQVEVTTNSAGQPSFHPVPSTIVIQLKFTSFFNEKNNKLGLGSFLTYMIYPPILQSSHGFSCCTVLALGGGHLTLNYRSKTSPTRVSDFLSWPLRRGW